MKRAPSPDLSGATQKNWGGDQPPDFLNYWGKKSWKGEQNKKQQKYLYRIAKQAENWEDRNIALKACTSVHWCNRQLIVEKRGDQMIPVGAWNCGKKYCSYCASKKRRKLLSRYAEFFKSENGIDILKKYDLALFTVTLRHNKETIRTEPYYQELQNHFRNALKYGAFKKYIAGGFYNTEHTYGDQGHHIHRHALLLIPKEFNLEWNFQQMNEELKAQWLSRTGDSFQVDLRPLGYKEDEDFVPHYENDPSGEQLTKDLLEVTKYIVKRGKNEIIPWEIVKAVEQNCRAKFYGRFGILYNVKDLNLNRVEEEQEEENKVEGELCEVPPEDETPIVPPEYYRVSGLKVKTKEEIIYRNTGGKGKKITVAISYQFRNQMKIPDDPDMLLKFQKEMHLAIFKWKLAKVDNWNRGFDAQKWREQRIALKSWIARTENNSKTSTCAPIQKSLFEVDPF